MNPRVSDTLMHNPVITGTHFWLYEILLQANHWDAAAEWKSHAPFLYRNWRKVRNLELLAVHGGDVSLLADSKGVGHRLSRSLGGDDEVIAFLFDLSNWLDVLGHLNDIFWKFWWGKYIFLFIMHIASLKTRPFTNLIWPPQILLFTCQALVSFSYPWLWETLHSSPESRPAMFHWSPCFLDDLGSPLPMWAGG